MVDTARKRIPDLVAEVDDAANLDAHFPNQSFDLVCTHFITGFVPLRTLAPKIWDRLKEGGYWSFVGGTMAGFPNLQAKADHPAPSLAVRRPQAGNRRSTFATRPAGKRWFKPSKAMASRSANAKPLNRRCAFAIWRISWISAIGAAGSPLSSKPLVCIAPT